MDSLRCWWWFSGLLVAVHLSAFLSMCEHDYPQCWFTLRRVLASYRYRCVSESSFWGYVGGEVMDVYPVHERKR
ncbi:hypothetical protein N8K09_003448 [Escherichia coli]|nr:hypothetical protein [Escherichia coli]